MEDQGWIREVQEEFARLMEDQGWIREVQEEFARLRPPHVEKKKATILALVDARLAGQSEETVWRLPTTCSRNTYHSKWKRDPVFARVLDVAYRAAVAWRDTKALRALKEAAEKLALASPKAVDKVITTMEKTLDESVRLRAAFGILDRADFSTAMKATQQVDASVGVNFDDDSIADILSILAATGALEPGAAEGGDPEADPVHPVPADAEAGGVSAADAA